MAKVKVTFLTPERMFIGEIGAFTPLYNVEIDDSRIGKYLLDGYLIVDAADMTTRYVYDHATQKAKKEVKQTTGSSPVPPSGTPGGTGAPGG